MSDDKRIAAAADDQQWPLLSLIRENGRGNLKYVGLGTITGVAGQFLSNLDMFIIGLAFDAMFNDQPYTLPLVPAHWIPADPLPQLWFTLIVLLVAKVGDLSTAISAQWAFFLFAQRTLHRIRVTAFDTVQQLGMGFFDVRQTGEVMSVLNNDVNSLEQFLQGGPNLAITAAAVSTSALLYMALLNWRLALVSLAVMPIIFVVNYWYGEQHEDRNDDFREETGVLNALLETNISGIQVVKAFGGETHERNRVEEQSKIHRTAAWRSHLVGVRHQPSLRLLAGVAFVATLFIGTEWVLDGSFWIFSGTLTAGELIPFLYYTQQLVQPVRAAAGFTGAYKSATSSAKRIIGVQRMEPPREEGTTDLERPEGHVEYDHVSFTYPGVDEPVLHDVTLDVDSGETVGIVGETGAGKSTLLKLLLAFYDPDEGTIQIDGHNIRDLSRESLRQSIGYVAQDPFLFNGTICENITYGVDDPDSEAVVEAAKDAGAHGFISNLDKDYDAEVGERGVKLSGGQRQRIAIARVLLADPPMLAFDEATSHVDNRTEVLVQRSLNEVTQDRTTFIVAHRLSTVRHADQIVVLDNGEIVEQGTHDELVEQGGQYADLWSVQIGAAEIGN